MKHTPETTIAASVTMRLLQRWRMALWRQNKFYDRPRPGHTLGAYEQAKLSNLIEDALRAAPEQWPLCVPAKGAAPASRSVSLIAPSAQTAAQGRARGPAKSSKGISRREPKQTGNRPSTR